MKGSKQAIPETPGLSIKGTELRPVRLVNIFVGVVLGACGLVIVPSAWGQVVIKDSHLKFNGFSYFRGNAENIQIGTHGDKKTPINSMNYLAADGVIPRDRLTRVEKAVVLTIDTSKTSKTDLFGNISDVAGVFGVSADVAWEKVKSQKLKLVKFTIDNESIKAAAIRSPKALSSLKQRGKGARIANQVLVVLSDEEAETFENSSSIEVSATDGKIKLTAGVSHGSSGSTSVTISRGSTFAYGLVKLDWNKGKNKIESVEDDQWSLN
jgi:hypothetical protein